MLTGTPSPGSAAAPHCCSLWSYTNSWFYLLPPTKMTIWEIRFFLLPPKYSFCPMFNWHDQSVFEVRITTQLALFGTAFLFFHYFRGTIFLLLFPSSVSSKPPLTWAIATRNAEVRPGPASHFLLPAVSCRGRGAAPLHLLSFCPFVSSIPAQSRVPGLSVLTLKAHTTRITYQTT